MQELAAPQNDAGADQRLSQIEQADVARATENRRRDRIATAMQVEALGYIDTIDNLKQICQAGGLEREPRQREAVPAERIDLLRRQGHPNFPPQLGAARREQAVMSGTSVLRSPYIQALVMCSLDVRKPAGGVVCSIRFY